MVAFADQVLCDIENVMCRSGAFLINSNLRARMEKQCKEEHEILDKIKKKMDRIRDRHIKERNRRSREMEEPSPDQEQQPAHVYQEPTDHYEGQS